MAFVHKNKMFKFPTAKSPNVQWPASQTCAVTSGTILTLAFMLLSLLHWEGVSGAHGSTLLSSLHTSLQSCLLFEIIHLENIVITFGYNVFF